MDTNEIHEVFERQRARRWELSVSSAEERRARLLRLKQAVLESSAALGEALNADLRRPNDGSPSLEIYQVVGAIDDAVERLDEWMAPTIVDEPSVPGTTARIEYEARGVVLLFGPWNYPFGLLLEPLVAAVAAGNTVLVKPNELTPATSKVAADVIRSVFPDDEVAVFEGGIDVAEALLELPVDHIFFTGSPAVGRRVMAAAARHLASVTLELGGKSPAIVDGTTDLATVAAIVAMSKVSNAGQICLSADYVYVPTALRDDFVDAYMKVVEATVYTDGAIDRTKFERIVNERNFDRVSAYIDDAVKQGAKLVGTGRRDRDTLTIEPVVLLDVPQDAAIMKEEIFGPVLPVLTYDSVDEVIAGIRAGEKPLAIYIYSSDPDLVERVTRESSSGGITVNGWATHVIEKHLPFGGVANSGQGAYHGVYGFRELSHARGISEHLAAQ